MLKIDSRTRQPLYGVAASRRMEHTAQATLPPHVLMQRAGLVVARLALALAPHARHVWIACGPGNNGGDGLEAAMHLQRWGKAPVVTWLGSADKAPPDAAASCQRAAEAGVTFAATPPHDFDLCIDALLGIGADQRAPEGRMAHWIRLMNAGTSPVLAVDLPTGLHADTGAAAQHSVNASHTLEPAHTQTRLVHRPGPRRCGNNLVGRAECRPQPIGSPGDHRAQRLAGGRTSHCGTPACLAQGQLWRRARSRRRTRHDRGCPAGGLGGPARGRRSGVGGPARWPHPGRRLPINPN